MPARQGNPGGHAKAIVFSNLNGRADESPTLQGSVKYNLPQEVAEEIEDVHSFIPEVRKKVIPGRISMTLVNPPDISWLNAGTIIGASLKVEFTNGLVLTAEKLTIVTNPVEKQATEGLTNELTFVFGSGTET